jgi:hypothetical protein
LKSVNSGAFCPFSIAIKLIFCFFSQFRNLFRAQMYGINISI